MPTSPQPPEYVLHGERITDEPALWAELGRAVAAPDGYYGRNLDALADCLRGGFAPEPPFVLLWRHAMVSAQALTRRVTGPDEEDRSYFDAVLDVLRQGGVTVRLR
ncbi:MULTISPECIES: barstar family protein [Kitasatospora]|uniref:barstar family protein n=1 Tax=Kitasatospora TaxID=2063 RepID=UPI0004C3237A|nr:MULTISPECIES: barstar family protein [unclassified Kitasatospora]WAL71632.1 barstar family protein [Kitasatospora sp. YST-16]WNW37670.1 barstar family protein [Streptomyces sp. Li-HN-5-13]